MVGVKHEHASAGSDGSLTCREQRAMLFRPKQIYTHPHIHVYVFIHSFIPRDDEKSGGKDANDDDDNNDGGAPEND